MRGVPRSPAAAEAVHDVPEVGRLAWMLFFEPVTLFHLLAEAGVSAPGRSLLSLLGEAGPKDRLYVRRTMLVLALVSPLMALALAAAVGLAFTPLPRELVLGMLGLGLLSGVLWSVASSVAFGAATAVAIPLAGVGAVTLLASSIHPATHPVLAAGIVGGTPGAAAGLVWSVWHAMTVGQPLSLRRGMVAVLVLGAMGVLIGVNSGGVVHGLMVGTAVVAGFLAFCFRLVLWPLEAVVQTVLFALERFTGLHTLPWTPVLWHDLSYAPLPFLGAHVVLGARRNPELARRVVASCFIAPGQRGVGRLLKKQLHALLIGDAR